MTSMLLALALGAAAAEAEDWSKPRPYLRPILNVRAFSVNGEGHAQATGGAAAGVVLRYLEPPHWLSHSRVQATGTYGLTSGSLGGDVRVGSFLGPDTKLIRWQVGPDAWFTGYGQPGAEDYHLPWAPGVDLSNTLLLKLTQPLQLFAEATPGWVFTPERQVGGLWIFHELTLTGALIVRTEIARLTVGYTRVYNAVGVTEGLVLSGAL